LRKRRLVSFVIGGAVAVGSLVAPGVAVAQTAGVHASSVRSVSARALLSRLPVLKETHKSTYGRSQFKAWIDADRDGEDTRAEVLKAESTRAVAETSSHTITTGRWVSRYDGVTVTRASKLDIDHVVPLREAWVSGAARWTAQKREAFANDLGYGAGLVAVTKHALRSKGDKAPNAYLPPRRSYRCVYVKNYIAVKYRWHLAVDVTEKRSLSKDLAAYCNSLSVKKPGEPKLAALIRVAPTPIRTTPTPTVTPTRSATPMPTPSAIPTSTPTPSSAPAPVATFAPVPTPTAIDLYPNCAAADAAGVTPLYRGQSGYSSNLDSDGDGIACESEAPVLPPVPTGASAVCRDGSLSYSAHRSGTCSGHGGVRTWL
jgi:hypothetical protein